jgi:tetratricopeptide (TPR) repeat protein
MAHGRKLGLIAIRVIFVASVAIQDLGFRQGIDPNTYFLKHFNYWSRCSDKRVDPEKRIESCKSMLGTGRGEADDVQIWVQIGDAHVEAMQFGSAMDAFNHALDAHGDHTNDSSIRERQDEALALSGHYEVAIAEADKLVKEGPDNAEFYNHRCWLRAIAGKELDAALIDCNEALKRAAKDAGTFDSRGLVNFKLGKMTDAAADYNMALSLDAHMPTSLYAKGIIELRGGKTAEGNDDITAAKRVEPLIADKFALYGVSP